MLVPFRECALLHVAVVTEYNGNVQKALYCSPTSITASSRDFAMSVPHPTGSDQRSLSEWLARRRECLKEEEDVGPMSTRVMCLKYLISYGYKDKHRTTYTYRRGNAVGGKRSRSGLDWISGVADTVGLVMPATGGGGKTRTISRGVTTGAGEAAEVAVDGVAGVIEALVENKDQTGVDDVWMSLAAGILGIPSGAGMPAWESMPSLTYGWILESWHYHGSIITLPPGPHDWSPMWVRCPKGGVGSPKDCEAAANSEIPPGAMPPAATEASDLVPLGATSVMDDESGMVVPAFVPIAR